MQTNGTSFQRCSGRFLCFSFHGEATVARQLMIQVNNIQTASNGTLGVLLHFSSWNINATTSAGIPSYSAYMSDSCDATSGMQNNVVKCLNWSDLNIKLCIAKYFLINSAFGKSRTAIFHETTCNFMQFLQSNANQIIWFQLYLWPWSTKPVWSRWGIFVEIAKNTLYVSKLSGFLLCQKSLGF